MRLITSATQAALVACTLAPFYLVLCLASPLPSLSPSRVNLASHLSEGPPATRDTSPSQIAGHNLPPQLPPVRRAVTEPEPPRNGSAFPSDALGHAVGAYGAGPMPQPVQPPSDSEPLANPLANPLSIIRRIHTYPRARLYGDSSKAPRATSVHHACLDLLAKLTHLGNIQSYQSNSRHEALSPHAPTVDCNDTTVQPNSVSTLRSLRTALQALDDLSTDFAAVDEVADHYKPNQFSTHLKDIVNVMWYLLSGIESAIYDVQVVDPATGPFGCDIKCIMDNFLDVIEKL